MKKILILVASVFTLMSCQKEDIQPNEPQDNIIKVEVITTSLSNTKLVKTDNYYNQEISTISNTNIFYIDTLEYPHIYVESTGNDFYYSNGSVSQGWTTLTVRVDDIQVFNQSGYGDQTCLINY